MRKRNTRKHRAQARACTAPEGFFCYSAETRGKRKEDRVSSSRNTRLRRESSSGGVYVFGLLERERKRNSPQHQSLCVDQRSQESLYRRTDKRRVALVYPGLVAWRGRYAQSICAFHLFCSKRASLKRQPPPRAPKEPARRQIKEQERRHRCGASQF